MLTMSMIKTRMIIIISKNKNVEDEYDEDKDDGNADKDEDDGNADKDRNDGNEANAGPSSASLDGREHRTRTLSPSAVRPSAQTRAPRIAAILFRALRRLIDLAALIGAVHLRRSGRLKGDAV